MAANSHSIIFFCLLHFSISSATRDHHRRHGSGFTASLFHRDSPLSPFYDPSLSHYDRLKNDFLRSFSRSHILFNRSIAVSPKTIQSPIIPEFEGYLMDVSIGTPPVKFIAIADTGSDLTWTQCLPCTKCFNQSRPIFNPLRSSSYHRMPCTSDYCHLPPSKCGSDYQTCNYSLSYGDNSYSRGELGFEQIALGSSDGQPFVLRNTVVGCGHENGGTFSSLPSGIIGLGGGPLSLVSQLSKISGVSRRFSYCLQKRDANLTTKINFGQDAIVSGPGVVSTPLILKDTDTFYYLTLEAISVGDKRHHHKHAAAAKEEGNIIMDSGNTLTFLPKNLYFDVISTLTTVIRAKRVDDPTGVLELCFAADPDDIDIPIITAHFVGADVRLLPLNTLVKVADNVTCVTLATLSWNFAIFGNLAQMNFLIGYDLEQRRIRFKPTICG